MWATASASKFSFLTRAISSRTSGPIIWSEQRAASRLPAGQLTQRDGEPVQPGPDLMLALAIWGGRAERISAGGRMMLDALLDHGDRSRVFRDKLKRFLSDSNLSGRLFGGEVPPIEQIAAEAFGVELREGAQFGGEMPRIDDLLRGHGLRQGRGIFGPRPELQGNFQLSRCDPEPEAFGLEFREGAQFGGEMPRIDDLLRGHGLRQGRGIFGPRSELQGNFQLSRCDPEPRRHRRGSHTKGTVGFLDLDRTATSQLNAPVRHPSGACSTVLVVAHTD